MRSLPDDESPPTEMCLMTALRAAVGGLDSECMNSESLIVAI